MWGTDGVRVFTVDDGWGWIFTAVEDWNAECVGWHVSLERRAARGLALRIGSVGPLHQPDQRQPPYAFVAEKFARKNRRIYRNIAELRDAVRDCRTLQCPVDRRKERLPEPRSSSSGVARRDLNQARRVTNSKEPGALHRYAPRPPGPERKPHSMSSSLSLRSSVFTSTALQKLQRLLVSGPSKAASASVKSPVEMPLR